MHIYSYWLMYITYQLVVLCRTHRPGQSTSRLDFVCHRNTFLQLKKSNAWIRPPKIKWLNMMQEVFQRVNSETFVSSGLLIGQARANHASLSCLGVRRNAPPKWEVGLTKVFVFCHYGGPNWYFCYSYACWKTCVRVIYASFDPPLEIVSLGEIFQNLYP